MAKRKTKRIPSKLKHDAIVEALLEMRFDTTTIPEVLLGRLADVESWSTFEQGRMPAYEIPGFLRQADPNLKYQPVFELHNADRTRSIRVGDKVLSYHRLPPYEGWKHFKPELDGAIDVLFRKADALTVRRLGLRYINAIRPELHLIDSITKLDLTVSVENERITQNVNVNFTADISPDTQCTVRIATPEFVQGAVPPYTSVLIDVDVFTKPSFQTSDVNKVKKWVESAHKNEKLQFFRLLPQATIDALEDK